MLCRTSSFRQELVGAFGDPVDENPDSGDGRGCLRRHGAGLEISHGPCPARGSARRCPGPRAMNWKGFNCTIPHKVAVIPLLDRLNPAAEIIGGRELRH